MKHDSSHEEWLNTAAQAEAKPEQATPKELRRAIAYLRYRRGALILDARRRARPRPTRRLAELDRRLGRFIDLLNGDE